MIIVLLLFLLTFHPLLRRDGACYLLAFHFSPRYVPVHASVSTPYKIAQLLNETSWHSGVG